MGGGGEMVYKGPTPMPPGRRTPKDYPDCLLRLVEAFVAIECQFNFFLGPAPSLLMVIVPESILPTNLLYTNLRISESVS